MARIAFVEDDPAVRQGLENLLVANGHTALPIIDYEHTCDALLASSPDLVLLDLGLPELDGMVVCREVRSRSQVPIIVVTSRTGEIDEVMSMTMGADDFVSKPYNSHVLLARIDALLRRVAANAQNATIMEHGAVRLDVGRSQVSCGGASCELTKNELRILAKLMRQPGVIVSREDLMYELWDSDSFIDDNTLTVNVNRLRRKLASIGASDYLHTHRGQGYAV